MIAQEAVCPLDQHTKMARRAVLALALAALCAFVHAADDPTASLPGVKDLSE